MDERRRNTDQVADTVVDSAGRITKQRGKQLRRWVVFGVIVTVGILSTLGWLVFHELQIQNATLHESIVTAQELSERNQEILERQRSTEQKLAKNLLRDNRRARQQLRTMRREHNLQLKLIRGIIRRAGRAELLEGLPTRIGGGARQQPPS